MMKSMKNSLGALAGMSLSMVAYAYFQNVYLLVVGCISAIAFAVTLVRIEADLDARERDVQKLEK